MKIIVTLLFFVSSALASADDSFSRALAAQVSAYLSETAGQKLAAEYEMLRDAPTVTGVAFPKFYIWVRARGSDDSIVSEGAMRIAETAENTFQVTDFVNKESISKEPQKLERIFPKLLLPKIYKKAEKKRRF